MLACMTPPPLPDNSASSLSAKQRRGRVLLLLIFVAFILIDLGLVALTVSRKGLGAGFPSCVRVCVTIALMYAVWIGQRWACWLLVALMYAASLLTVVALISRPHPVLLAMLLVFVLTGTLIGFYSAISSFLELQRERRQAQRRMATYSSMRNTEANEAQ